MSPKRKPTPTLPDELPELPADPSDFDDWLASLGTTDAPTKAAAAVPPAPERERPPTYDEIRREVIVDKPGKVRQAGTTEYDGPTIQKIKRTAEGIAVDLVPNEDIIAGLQGDFIKVGFAAETQDVLTNAESKIAKKGLDLIAANDVTAAGSGFATDTNHITLIDASGTRESLPLLSKYDAGNRILDRVVALLSERAG